MTGEPFIVDGDWYDLCSCGQTKVLRSAKCMSCVKAAAAARRICPSCGGRKRAASLRCRTCAGKAARVAHLCAECGGPVSNAATKLCRPCYQATLNPGMPMGGAEAIEYGATVILENAAGERLVLTGAGRVRAVVTELAATARRLDASFAVICVSTPNTVYADLQGARMHNRQGFGGRPASPELGIVPRALLHHRIRDGYQERR